MSNLFYVKDVNGRLVPAQFLTNNTGQQVSDVNAANARQIKIYDSSGAALINPNPNGFLVVPYGYSIDEALSFGRYVAGLNNTPATPGVGLTQATMILSPALNSASIRIPTGRWQRHTSLLPVNRLAM